MRSARPGDEADDGPGVAYETLKAVAGGGILCLGWAASFSGGLHPVVGGVIGVGTGLVGSAARGTAVGRVALSATLVALAAWGRQAGEEILLLLVPAGGFSPSNSAGDGSGSASRPEETDAGDGVDGAPVAV